MRTLLRYAFHFTAAVASLVHISYGTVLASQHAQNAALRDLDATWKAWEEDKGSNRRIKIPPPTPEQLRALRTWTALAADLPPSTAQKVAHLQAEILETLLNYKVASRYEHSSFFLHMGIAAHWQPPAPRRHVVCLLQEHRPTLLENTELVVDAFRVAGRYLCAHRLASALEAGGKHAGMRKWENICKAMKQPAAFGPQLFKEHLQQHAAVIITALRRKDAGRPCDVAGRPLPAGARLSSADAAERPAGAIASCARSHRRGGSKSISKPQDASRPLSLEDAAAAQARAQAAMDELLLEEEGTAAQSGKGGHDPLTQQSSRRR